MAWGQHTGHNRSLAHPKDKGTPVTAIGQLDRGRHLALGGLSWTLSVALLREAETGGRHQCVVRGREGVLRADPAYKANPPAHQRQKKSDSKSDLAMLSAGK
jgi:hypothetical protein